MTDRFHIISDKIKTVEAALIKNTELMDAMVDYANTRAVFEDYKSTKYQ